MDEFVIAFPDQPVKEPAVFLISGFSAVRTGRNRFEAALLHFDDRDTIAISRNEMPSLPVSFAGEGVGDGRECLIKGHGTEA